MKLFHYKYQSVVLNLILKTKNGQHSKKQTNFSPSLNPWLCWKISLLLYGTPCVILFISPHRRTKTKTKKKKKSKKSTKKNQVIFQAEFGQRFCQYFFGGACQNILTWSHVPLLQYWNWRTEILGCVGNLREGWDKSPPPPLSKVFKAGRDSGKMGQNCVPFPPPPPKKKNMNRFHTPMFYLDYFYITKSRNTNLAIRMFFPFHNEK